MSTRDKRGPFRRWSVGVSTLALAAAGLVAATPPAQAADDFTAMPPLAQRGANAVTADSLPTAQIGNGVVWTQKVVGDTVYAGGDFSTARPPGAAAGTNEVSRANLLAYSIKTGELLPFNPGANSKVYAFDVSPDGKRLYVGGAFTQIGGQARYRIAAFDLSTGALISSFAPAINYTVKSIVATNDTVYVGGMFTAVGSVPRQRLAAFSASNGALSSWAPTADDAVQSMVLSPEKDKLIVGGNFGRVNGETRRGIAALNPGTGSTMPWAANALITVGGIAPGQNVNQSGITSVSTDGRLIYATGFSYAGAGNLEGTIAMNPSDGSMAWIEDCHGDSYGSFPAPTGVLYVSSHSHYCGNVGGFWETKPWSGNQQRALAFGTTATGRVAHNGTGGYADWHGSPAPSLYNWFPRFDVGTFTGQDQATWTVAGNDQYVVFGGEFPKVNGAVQQGLARFATRPVAPGKRGPKYGNADFVPQMSSPQSGTVRVAFPGNVDDDDSELTYTVYRDGAAISTLKRQSTFWDRRTVVVNDAGRAPGATHSYRVRAMDADGNVAWGNPVSYTVPASFTASAYQQRVLADGASEYWRMGETNGTFANSAGTQGLTYNSAFRRGVPGAISGEGNTAGGTSSAMGAGVATTSQQTAPPERTTVETWVQFSGTRGGRIGGFSDPATSRRDRMLYVDNSGRINWGVAWGSNASNKTVITTPRSYNDNKWHHVVGTVGPAGMQLYVDGELRESSSSITGAHMYGGYWRIGQDVLTGWANAPTSSTLNGAIDEFAVYPTQLSAERIAAHNGLGRTGQGGAANQAPTASFTSAVTESKVTFDGSASSDPDGQIVSYAWDFGDGSTGTGEQATRTYAKSGTYTVKLTVTDDGGATQVITKQVTVAAANVAPTADFVSRSTGLGVSLDAATSKDSDGQIASYAWDFGDGSSGTGMNATHTYATAGTYPVTLTVTDDKGATASTTTRVAVSDDPLGAAFAQDAFERSSASGLGAADVGGTYTLTGGASKFGVTDGQGWINVSAVGVTNRAVLASVSADDVDTKVDLALDKAAAGANVYTSLLARRTGTSDYRAQVLWRTDGQVALYLVKTVDGKATTLRSGVVPDLRPAPGQRLTIRLKVVGTTLQAKVWVAGSAEPTAWTATATDAGPALPAGAVGLETYIGASATNLPLKITLDNLSAQRAAG